jgi:hypothetical protein
MHETDPTERKHTLSQARESIRHHFLNILHGIKYFRQGNQSCKGKKETKYITHDVRYCVRQAGVLFS